MPHFATSEEAKQYMEEILKLTWHDVEARFLEQVPIPLGYVWFMHLDKEFAEEISTIMAEYILGHSDGVLAEFAIETAREWIYEYGKYGDKS